MNRLHVLLDLGMTMLAYTVAWFLIIGSRIFPDGHGVLPAQVYFTALVGILPLYLLLYWGFNLYRPKRTMGRRAEFLNICKANTLGLMVITFVLYAGRRSGYFGNFSTRVMVLFFFINIASITLERNFIRMILGHMRARGFNQKHILLVGFSEVAESFIDRVVRNSEWGYHIYGMLDDLSPVGSTYRHIEVVGKISDLQSLLEGNDIDEIVITLPLAAYEKLAGIVHVCEKSGVHTKFVPDYHEIIYSKPVTEDMDGLPLINIRNVPLTDPMKAIAKRTLDIVGASFALLLFSPIMLVTALAVKLGSPGPLIFKQERVGLHNKPFMMYKFRSMVEQRPEDEEKGWTTRGDARVTKVGRIIRSTSIDEMPQFINVLKGDMSLVGPRPERTQFVEKFKEEIPRYMIKHQVRPGITGWAQINGLRGDTSIQERIHYDLYYIENWTMGFDIKILFLTVFKGFVNKNAY